jgi:hypothetical protein
MPHSWKYNVNELQYTICPNISFLYWQSDQHLIEPALIPDLGVAVVHPHTLFLANAELFYFSVHQIARIFGPGYLIQLYVEGAIFGSTFFLGEMIFLASRKEVTCLNVNSLYIRDLNSRSWTVHSITYVYGMNLICNAYIAGFWRMEHSCARKWFPVLYLHHILQWILPQPTNYLLSYSKKIIWMVNVVIRGDTVTQ